MLTSPLQSIIDRFKTLKPPFPTQYREPATGAQALALSGAILVHTEDHNNIVITPELARKLATALPKLADQAEAEAAL